MLPAIRTETGNTVNASVIWLHGLGADGNDFAPIVEQLRLPAEMGVRFIFPHAPSIPVTVNGGFVMPAWYDILHMKIDRQVDTEQLKMSAELVKELIDDERQQGIDSNRIVLAGFSQGGAVAYEAALSYPSPLAGLLVMSSYFPTSETIALHEANSEIPIAVHHGQHDPVVPVSLGKKAVETLEQKDYSVDYREYPMEHEVCIPQVEEISAWLQSRLQ